jgi:hypothetical protein
MADEGVVIKISGNTEDVEKAFKQLGSLLKGAEKNTKTFSDVAKGAISSFIGNLASTAVSNAFGLIKDGFRGLINQIGESVTAANVQEDALNKLNFALANSGKFSESASLGLQKFASELQRNSTLGDEVILKNAALIQSLGQLDEQGLKRATQAAADLSSAIGIDFDSASRLLGKASTGNVEALKRYGIQIENTGDSTRDFSNALREIENRFGGAAANAANTFSGAITQTKNSFGDLQEEFGLAITQTPALKGAFQGINDVIVILTGFIKNNKESISDLVDNGIQVLIGGFGRLGSVVGGFLDVGNYLLAFFDALEEDQLRADNDWNRLGLTILNVKKWILEVAGANTDATNAAIEESEKRIAQVEKEREAIQNEVLDRDRSVQNFKKLAQDALDFTKETIQERVDAAREAGTQENVNFLNQLSEKREIQNQNDQILLDQLRATNEQLYQESIDVLGKVKAEELKAQNDRLLNENKVTELKRAQLAQRDQIERNSIFGIRKYEELTQKERLQNLKDSFNSIATLQASSNKTLFAIGKASAISTATIDGIQAVQKALASAPPPFNFAIAALVGVAQAANLAKIASAQPPQGFALGGVVQGGVPGIDSVPILAQQGEIIAPPKSFDEVVEGTARARGFSRGDENQGVESRLDRLLELLDSKPTIVIQGDVLSDELYINRLAEQLREAVQFRNAKLA